VKSSQHRLLKLLLHRLRLPRPLLGSLADISRRDTARDEQLAQQSVNIRRDDKVLAHLAEDIEAARVFVELRDVLGERHVCAGVDLPSAGLNVYDPDIWSLGCQKLRPRNIPEVTSAGRRASGRLRE